MSKSTKCARCVRNDFEKSQIKSSPCFLNRILHCAGPAWRVYVSPPIFFFGYYSLVTSPACMYLPNDFFFHPLFLLFFFVIYLAFYSPALLAACFTSLDCCLPLHSYFVCVRVQGRITPATYGISASQRASSHRIIASPRPSSTSVPCSG